MPFFKWGLIKELLASRESLRSFSTGVELGTCRLLDDFRYRKKGHLIVCYDSHIHIYDIVKEVHSASRYSDV